MALILILTGIYLLSVGFFSIKKFQFYGLLTAIACTVLSIELLADIKGLTLGVLTLFTLLRLPSVKIKIRDAFSILIIAIPCIFWMSTQEFVDGFAYSYVFVALGVALSCNLLFEKQKRQTLCALVLLSSFVICNFSNTYVDVIDMALAFLIGIIFTQDYTLSTDLITIDSYGTSL